MWGIFVKCMKEVLTVNDELMESNHRKEHVHELGAGLLGIPSAKKSCKASKSPRRKDKKLFSEVA